MSPSSSGGSLERRISGREAVPVTCTSAVTPLIVRSAVTSSAGLVGDPWNRSSLPRAIANCRPWNWYCPRTTSTRPSSTASSPVSLAIESAPPIVTLMSPKPIGPPRVRRSRPRNTTLPGMSSVTDSDERRYALSDVGAPVAGLAAGAAPRTAASMEAGASAAPDTPDESGSAARAADAAAPPGTLGAGAAASPAPVAVGVVR